MLSGIRVIDFSMYLPGPYSTLRLADLGADIIKVESLKGDPARATDTNKESYDLVFQANNRNKRSIALNLKEKTGRDKALLLIEKADVVLESFRPGVMHRLGLDYETVKKIKPDIIYCSLSGYGQTGTMSKLGSHDLNYMAVSGVLDQFRNKEGQPVHPSITLADLVGGIGASEAILAALIQKQRTGQGAWIDLAITDVLTSLMNSHLLIEQKTGEHHGVSLLGGTIVSYCIYETKDHRFVSLAALEEKFWINFCHGVGKSEWLSSHHSPTHEDNHIFKSIQGLFMSRTLQEWRDFGLQVDCCLTPILRTDEIVNYPSSKTSRIIENKWGERHVKTHFHTSLDQAIPPPNLDEHHKQIMSEVVEVAPKNRHGINNRSIERGNEQ